MSLVAELQRRRVFRALVGYGIAAFAILQIIEPIMHGLHWPEAVLGYVVVALALGFPLVVTLAWVFDVNAGRIERTGPSAPATGLRGARLAILLVGIGVLAATPGVVWYFFVRDRSAPSQVSTATAVSPVDQPTAQTPSIAVLPFLDMSPGKDQEYFSDGISEEILNALAQVEGLQVTGRTSSFSFRGKNEDLRSIGQKLGVGAVLEGSVRKVGNRVRVTTQVIKVADGFHLWSQTYDRDLSDIFAVQDEIARAVVAAMKVKLFPGQAGIAEQRRTTSHEAYAEYLRGRHFAKWDSLEGNRLAAEAFQRSIALDPEYAPSHAGLAVSLERYLSWLDGPPAPTLKAASKQQAEEEAEKAVLLAADFESYSARGWIRTVWTWDWAGAEADMKRAVSLGPGDATAQMRYGHLMAVLGRLTEAIAITRKVTEIDPLDANAWFHLGWYYNATGQTQLARQALSRALEISPQSEYAALNLAITELLEKRPKAALERVQPPWQRWMRNFIIAMAQHDLGRAQESQNALQHLLSESRGTSASQIAEVYAWRGEYDSAFEWLERARVQRDPGSRYVKYDPVLRNLRGDPRYTALLKKMNLPVD